MDQAAQHVATTDSPGGRRCGRRPGLPDRSLELQLTTRSLLLVVADVRSEHALEMASGEDEHPVRASARTVLTNRSATPFARGALTGVRITVASSMAKTSSKDLVNFESRSRTRYRTLSRRPSTARFRACPVTHAE